MLLGWLVDLILGGLVDWWVVFFGCLLIRCLLIDCFVALLVDWLIGRSVGWLVGLLIG